ncbi:MAG: phosphomannomutase [Acidobacteria bacterium]|nr:phosphomannomutase [Acidobacteriota bacterium]
MPASASPTPASSSCFKAYDIRGRVPDELDAALAYRIGRAFAAFLGARRVALGHDVRHSSPEIAGAVREALVDAGVEVLEVGTCGTEQVYFATIHLGLDGGIMVTASHNPVEYNGLKLVRERGRPISADTGLPEIERLARGESFPAPPRRGRAERIDLSAEYVAHLLGYVDPARLRPLRVVTNAGNGGAGAVVDRLEPHLPFRLLKVHHEPDGSFPNGVPNPLLPGNRSATSRAVLEQHADAGVAWDGDFDRCFFFDERGQFVDGSYVVPMLAERALSRHPGARIVHDPRVVWATIETVRRAGGEPVPSKGGHAFMKETMRRVDAAYGGENPGHHFFREFGYCDSGMIPWLVLLEHVCGRDVPLGQLVAAIAERHPASGEINLELADPARALELVLERYAPAALAIDRLDGVSAEFAEWRFNVRPSNTEPLVRVNLETRGDRELLAAKTDELLAVLRA